MANESLVIEHEGVSLAEWVARVVSEDRAERMAAGDALVAMDAATREARGEEDGRTIDAAIKAAVGALLAESPDFVQRLICLELLSKEGLSQPDVNQRGKRRRGKNSADGGESCRPFAERMVGQLKLVSPGGERQAMVEQLTSLLSRYVAGAGRRDDGPAGAEGLLALTLGPWRVLSVLDEELLHEPGWLELLLRQYRTAELGYQALRRLGPRAKVFGPPLFEELDRTAVARSKGQTPRPAVNVWALGAVIRGEAAMVEAVLERVGPKDPRRQMFRRVAETMEADLCGRERAFADAMLASLADADERLHVLEPLASVGRHLADVRARVIELAKPRPAQPRVVSGFPGHIWDPVMCERGVAIQAMRYFSDHAEECMPVLLEALDSFEEFDPDETYEGPHGRIASVLQAFGPAAGGAAVALAERMDEPEADFPRAILDALEAMGSAGKAALPVVEAYRARLWAAEGEPMPNLEADWVDRYEDPVGLVIQRMRRG